MTPTTVDALAEQIPDGALLALPPAYGYVPTALIHALIRRGARDLRLLCVPIGGIAVDLLIGAGCVAEVEAAAVSLAEAGPAPAFTRAVEQGRVRMRDTTCPAVHSALQATEKGVPFMPLGGVIGSDIERHRDDWRVVDDPMDAGGGRILLVPAIQPDFALIHGVVADRDGNVWIGRRREMVTMAHAAKTTLATVERMQDESLLADEASAAATLPGLYMGGIAEAPRGALPQGLADHYAPDAAAIADYARMAKTEDGFRSYLEAHVLAPAADAAAHVLASAADAAE